MKTISYTDTKAPAWRALWWVYRQGAGPRSDTNGDPNYLFLPIERISPDAIVGLIARAERFAPGEEDFFLDKRPFRVFRRMSYDHQLFSQPLRGEPVMFTSDGVSLWKVVEYYRDVTRECLVFEMRRCDAPGFFLTGSPPSTWNLSFITDAAIRDELAKYLRVVEDALKNEQWDLVARDSGNACDRVILFLLLKHMTASGESITGAQDPRKSWDHKRRIQELHQRRLIDEGSLIHYQLEVARSLSNTRHAGHASAKGIELSPFDAMGAYAALRHLLRKFGNPAT